MSRLIMWQASLAIALALAGIAFLGWGVKSSSEIMSAFGGALFGASIEKLLTLLTNKDFGDMMLEILKRSLNSTVRSDEDDAEAFRKMLYFYHPTSVQGQLAWRCDNLDFSGDISVGSLTAVCKVATKSDSRFLRYVVSAAVRGKRLVLIRQPDHKHESPSIAVLPHIGEYYRYDSGLVFKQTWDGAHVAAPCILSFQPLAKLQGEGFVDPSDYEKLQELWSSQFPQLNKGCQISFGWK